MIYIAPKSTNESPGQVRLQSPHRASSHSTGIKNTK